MSKPIIEVEHLSKCYRIGAAREPYLSLRDELARKARRVSSAVSRIASKGSAQPPSSETDFWALNDVSFSVQEGDAVGIIGRNGAGKSTLLKILSRITPPTKGRITMRGRVASLLEVGTGFHPELTGRENIFLNGAVLGMRREEIKRKFDEIVAFSEVEKFLDTPVKRYSSGMYVRLAFAVAAHLEPEILVVDEVLAVGDAAFQKKCLGKMGDVTKEGRTVLFVSHNMAAVRSLCTSGIVLVGGRLDFRGTAGGAVDGYFATLEGGTKHTEMPLARNKSLGICFEGYYLEKDAGQLTPVLETGVAGAICLRFSTERSLGDVLVSLGVNSTDDVRVCLFHSKISGAELSIPAGGGIIYCRIPKIPLRPGFYRITVKIVSGGDTVFWLPHSLEIQIVEGDFYKTAKLPADGGGLCLVEHSWAVKPCNSAFIREGLRE